MAIKSRLMGSGLSPQVATNIVGDSSGALTAAGTSQGTALLLSSANNYVSIVSSSGKGVQLPAVDIDDIVWLHNGGANTVHVYGQTGEAIQDKTANSAYPIATKLGCAFRKVSTTLWSAIKSA